jgi:protein-disulfide isomerase
MALLYRNGGDHVAICFVFTPIFLPGENLLHGRARHAIMAPMMRHVVLARRRTEETAMQRVDEIGNAEHVRGPEDAALTVIEYADFQCPYSARAHIALRDLDGRFGGIRLVYRHLPLAHLHPLAELAAEAAEAAGSQGRFWDMHDVLFERQHQVRAKQDLAVLAESLDLDIERFRAEILERRQRARVQADAERARHDGATGTPTLYINGVRYRGDSDRASLERALTGALER